MIRTTTATALALALLAAPAFAQDDASGERTTRAQGQQTQQAGQQRAGERQTGQEAQRQESERRTGEPGQQDRQAAQGRQERGEADRQAGMQGGEGTMTADQMVVSQRRVIGALNDAGFHDVRIMDAAYLVYAMTDNDEEVMMVVNSAGQPISPGRQGQGQGRGQGMQRQ